MKLFEIVGKVGAGIVRNVVPGGAAIIDVVNEFLPHDKKLPADATGSHITNALSGLPPEKVSEILHREFDVVIAQQETIKTMLQADVVQKHTTRPYIAKGAFHVVAFAILITVSVWGYGVFMGDSEMVAEIMNGWPFILAVLGPLITLLSAYFGVLKNEQKHRLDASNGLPTGGVAATLTNLFKR